ncbi:hypothetical protein ZWY2020_038036 [Hordeum vulgare]|nr:hypothetical protein ZWY2020_038036 [Hordeum vulgare]
MASGGGVMAGKKRKSAEMGRVDVPARREPRRGLGVAALESIRAQLETAESFYVFPSLATATAAAAPPTPQLPSLLAGHVAGVRFDPYVGNGAAQRDYYPHYYGAEHYTLARRYMQQLQASSGQPAPRHHDHHHAWQSNAPAVATAAAPPILEQDHRRRAQVHGGHARKPYVAFVDLVDSDEEDGRGCAGEELDLELKL